MASFEIKHRNGEVFTVLVDDGDLESVLSAGPWRVQKSYRNLYAYARVEGRRVLLHRFLLKPAQSVDIDHINANGLDNRRENLRETTDSFNQGNRRLNANSTSGFKGVSWHESANGWVARIQVSGVRRHLGVFHTAEEAHAAYCRAAVLVFGEFARFK